MAATSVHQRIGEFLRRRREACDPANYGVGSGRRRTPGLRREEVAELAGISTDWYARLEQGRESMPSAATMNALAVALRLDDAERRHLLVLGNARGRPPFPRETVPANLRQMVHALETPAYLVGARRDLLCWNAAATQIFRDFAQIPAAERNMLYQMFTEPLLRTRFVHWADEARSMLEGFRADYDQWSHTPEFAALVDALTARSPEFCKWWKRHAVRSRSAGMKEMRHPRLGTIRLRYSTFRSDEAPDLTLVMYTRID